MQKQVLPKEKIPEKVDHRYFEAAERLWQILDNIDALSDMIKPTSLKGYAAFYQGVMNRVGERFKILISDGYNLFLPKEDNLTIKEEQPKEEKQPCDANAREAM
jgi:hypothetical protein